MDQIVPAWRRIWSPSKPLAIALAAGAILFATADAARADEVAPLEYQVKAAFLLNFTKFVVWPDTAFAQQNSPLSICLLGEDPFGGSLDAMVKGESVHGHELAIQRIRRAPEARTCQVLFIPKSERDVARVLDESGPGVLTVGEGDAFLRQGGIIAFIIDNRRVRFDINQRAATNAMLTISARLMMVARSVRQ